MNLVFTFWTGKYLSSFMSQSTRTPGKYFPVIYFRRLLALVNLALLSLKFPLPTFVLARTLTKYFVEDLSLSMIKVLSTVVCIWKQGPSLDCEIQTVYFFITPFCLSFAGSFQEAESEEELCAMTKISRGGPLGAKCEILWTCVRNVLSLIRWKELKIRYQHGIFIYKVST